MVSLPLVVADLLSYVKAADGPVGWKLPGTPGAETAEGLTAQPACATGTVRAARAAEFGGKGNLKGLFAFQGLGSPR